MLFQLWTAHYSYTGTIATIRDDFSFVRNHAYTYPYFADEWYHAGLIDSTLDRQAIPLQNPFIGAEDWFFNHEFLFHTFNAGIFSLLPDTLTAYVPIGMAMNTLLIICAYAFLRKLGITPLISAITSAFLLHIPHAANMPSFWSYIPFTTGIILFIVFLGQLHDAHTSWIILSAIAALLIYPPLLILIFPLLIIHVDDTHKQFLIRGTVLTSTLLLIILSIAGTLSPLPLFRIFRGKLVFINLIGAFSIRFLPFRVIPMILLLFLAIGAKRLFSQDQHRPLRFCLIVLGSLWTFYQFTPVRLLLAHPRVVVLAAILVTIAGSIGLTALRDSLRQNCTSAQASIIWGTIILLLIIALTTRAARYTELNDWQGFYAYSTEGKNIILLPNPPANRYLTAEDLSIFSNISESTFLAPPWKGTTIGITTGNRPVTAKSGTIALKGHVHYEFLKGNCSRKHQIAHEDPFDYVYTSSFDCLGFLPLRSSSEGLTLYRYTG
ncbi:MAG: hypothetical protein ACOCWQ_04290 [Nanoarchaeota archaeon]